MVSNLQEHIKAGINHIPKITTRFKQKLSTFYDQIPPERMKILDFDQLIKEHGDSTTGFLSEIGVNLRRTIRTNTSIKEPSARLIYRLNKLPIETIGSPLHIEARSLTLQAINSEFSTTQDNSLNTEVLYNVINEGENEDIQFVREKFGIKYDPVSPRGRYDLVEGYLSDTSDIDISRLKKVADRLRAPYLKTSSVDNILISIYMTLLTVTQIKHHNS